MWDGLAHLDVQSIVLSPDYAKDGTLLAYSTYRRSPTIFTEAITSVSRSTDRGLHWTLVTTGTVPAPEVLLAPGSITPDWPFRPGRWWAWDRWIPEARSWSPRLGLPVSVSSVRAILPPKEGDSAGMVYVLADAGLLRRETQGSAWGLCHEPRLDGRDDTNALTVAAWAGDQIAIGTAAGEVLLLAPADLRCQ
jgi:hypothetical protein